MRTVTILALAVAILVSLTACDETTAPEPGNAPAGLLALVEEAFNNRDIDLLARFLASGYTFYFDEDDVGTGPGDYVIPESWGKDEFTVAAEYMFEQAHTIEMEVDTSNVGTPGNDDTIYFAGDIEVELLVMVDAVNGYMAHGFCDFEFVDTGAGAGPDNWVIRNWWDHTSVAGSGGRNITPASIGFILVVFE